MPIPRLTRRRSRTTPGLSKKTDRPIALEDPIKMCPHDLENRSIQLRRRLSRALSAKMQPFPVWYSRRRIQPTVPRFAETD